MFKAAVVFPSAILAAMILSSGAKALETENGLAFNGLAFNGLAFNGLAFNGLAFNGTKADGLTGPDRVHPASALQATGIILENGEHIPLK